MGVMLGEGKPVSLFSAVLYDSVLSGLIELGGSVCCRTGTSSHFQVNFFFVLLYTFLPSLIEIIQIINSLLFIIELQFI